MANYEREYQRVTRTQVIKCVRWCQNTLNLRDWHIDINVGMKEGISDSLGFSDIEKNGYTYIAHIWVDLDAHKKENANAYMTTCHEMLHILTLGTCHLEEDKDEPICYTLEGVLYEKFCNDNNIKIMPLREL